MKMLIILLTTKFHALMYTPHPGTPFGAVLPWLLGVPLADSPHGKFTSAEEVPSQGHGSSPATVCTP